MENRFLFRRGVACSKIKRVSYVSPSLYSSNDLSLFISFFFLDSIVYMCLYTTFILTQWCYSVVLCMSLLDSACRIGHRKYLLNELIMRPKIHTTLFRLQSRRRRTGESVDPSIPHRFLGASNPRMPGVSRDPWIRGSFDPWMFPKPKIPETSNSRISGTLGLSVLGFGRSGSRILGFWQSGIADGSFDPWILS